MTQYEREVEERREQIAHEKWLKMVSSLHANNGYLETRYNDGRIEREKIRQSGKT